METFNDIVAELRTYTATHVSHSHKHAHLIMPLQGELVIANGTNQHRVNEQTLLFVPPNLEHNFYSTVRNEFLVLDIPSGLVSACEMPGKGNSCEAITANNQWKGIRYLILQEMEQPYSHAALRDLFPYISRCLQQKRSLPRSIRYIHEHYDEPITVQKLAEYEHYNPTYYSEWFMKETGKSPSSYIQEVRLNEAKKLLRNSNMPILYIAIQVGLGHQSSLTRLFVKHEQQTPSQYRQQYKN
ncbi:AraC family transcriptional regulator [Paenibacillus albiflavus]|uniref:AraC family transcriptional regulator n=1 Tax=Paenibacillus albiflavus TaxID=2545760 RepID=A0A4R4EH19_9BACL|nr:AraC family transcriptional regulator [Paenibacillus albiflavus]TCZ79396.1 AraC family transcriptional regulator [Paenibacillus albiflavus]